MTISRRGFITTTAALAATGATAINLTQADAKEKARSTDERPLFVSTWPFGKPANEAALKAADAGGTMLDAVEAGVRHAELAGISSVGLSGKPNAIGAVQLDACIMCGKTHRAGSVAAVEGIVHAITVARRVMEKTPHVMLVGEGARWFALEEGLESRPVDREGRHEAWLAQRARLHGTQQGKDGPDNSRKDPEVHDTIALLALGADGSIAGGCSTSGWADKMHGRVGDSPIIGSALYVDNEVGAAGATGLGENIMRYCGSFLVVELMRHGMSPARACRAVVERIAADPNGHGRDVNFIALDKTGRYGAAGSSSFAYSVTTSDESRVLTAKPPQKKPAEKQPPNDKEPTDKEAPKKPAK